MTCTILLVAESMNVHGVCGAVSNVDARGGLRHTNRWGTFSYAAHPFGEDDQSESFCETNWRPPVESVTASFGSERMKQGEGLSQGYRNDQVNCTLEILARLFVSPRNGIRRQLLEMEDAIAFAVTGVAAGVARSRFDENGLDVGLVKREIERNRRLR